MNKFFWNLKTRYYKLFRYLFPFNFILKKENDNLITLIRQIDTDKKNVLDLGVGTGNVLNFIDGAKNIIGIDLTFLMLREVQKKFLKINLVQADALSTPLKSKSLDMITAVGLTEYIKDTTPLFQELYRVLKVNSFLIITFSPNNYWTRLRLLMGHRIYSMSFDQFIKKSNHYKFQIIDYQRSMMQRQVLLQKMDN